MSSNRHLGMAMLWLVLVVGTGGLLLVWPAYRAATDLDRQAEVLRNKGENYDLQARRIASLTTQLDEITHRVETGLKVIPGSADIAGLMQRLSMPVDGVHVHDQTFTVGDLREAVPGGGLSARVQPLTVEVLAKFDTIFTLIRRAESMSRLLRIASITIVTERRPEYEDLTVAKASIVLEAVFDPSSREVH